MCDECCRFPVQLYSRCYTADAEKLIFGRAWHLHAPGNDIFFLLYSQGSPWRMRRRVYKRLMAVLRNLNLNLPHKSCLSTATLNLQPVLLLVRACGFLDCCLCFVQWAIRWLWRKCGSNSSLHGWQLTTWVIWKYWTNQIKEGEWCRRKVSDMERLSFCRVYMIYKPIQSSSRY